MKKTILITALAAFSLHNANAQLSIRPEIGFNSAKTNMRYTYQMLDTASGTTAKISYEGGFSLRAGIIAGLSLEAGVLYRHMQFESVRPTIMLDGKIYEPYKLNYGIVPVSLNYDFDLGRAGSIFIGAGGYWAHAFSGSYQTPADPDFSNRIYTVDLAFGYKRPDDYKPNDMGWLLQAGYNTPVGIFIRLRYDKGMQELSTRDEKSYKNTAFSFSIGYDLKIIKEY